MPRAYAAYKAVSSGLFAVSLPTVGACLMASKKYRKEFAQRLGIYRKQYTEFENEGPKIWFHAASVGEVGVAISIMAALKRTCGACNLILSTTTVHGRSIGGKMASGMARCVYAPVDFVGSVRLALSAIRPEVMVWVETELWPNWMVQARHLGIKTAIVNGRLSPRSESRYGKIRGLFNEVLPCVDAFSMIGEEDAARIGKIGAPADRITVNGNAKYDQLVERATAELRRETIAGFQIGNRPVLVAGSTRTGEEVILMDAFLKLRDRFPDLLLIIAPRHIFRAAGIAQMAKEKGAVCQLRSKWTPDHTRNTEVVVLDTYGELFAFYSLATLSFCGGSLVPKGGQNPMEAAVWGVPVLFGKSMEDFETAANLLTAGGGGFTVADGNGLAEHISGFLSSPRQIKTAGASARRIVENHSGAAHRHAAVIGKLLGDSAD